MDSVSQQSRRGRSDVSEKREMTEGEGKEKGGEMECSRIGIGRELSIIYRSRETLTLSGP